MKYKQLLSANVKSYVLFDIYSVMFAPQVCLADLTVLVVESYCLKNHTGKQNKQGLSISQ